MQSITRWTSPTQCGCVLERTTTWFDDHGDGQYDRVVDGATAILAQCATHAAYPDAASLYAELQHFHATVHRPDTCGCSLVYHWDDRQSEDARVHTPVRHPVNTKCCASHAHHAKDHVAHHDAVTLENVRKNQHVNAVATSFNCPPEMVAWQFDAQRNLVIDHTSIGATRAQVAAALAKVP